MWVQGTRQGQIPNGRATFEGAIRPFAKSLWTLVLLNFPVLVKNQKQKSSSVLFSLCDVLLLLGNRMWPLK